MNTIKIVILYLLLALTGSVSAQDSNWTDHMSTLKPDTLPPRAKADHNNGSAPKLIDIGRGLGTDDDFYTSSSWNGTGVDTAHQTILLIGDSMLDGLGSRFVDYAAENGDEFHAVIWYGSNTMHWATTRDLEYQIERVHPTFIILSLGYNDLGYYNYEKRARWVDDIIRKFGNIPFVWIGPLPRRGFRDRRIVDIIRERVGEKRFFDSSHTVCARIDGNHPTMGAAAKWVDNIAGWMSTPGLTAHPIRMDRPTINVAFHADEKHNTRYHGRN